MEIALKDRITPELVSTMATYYGQNGVEGGYNINEKYLETYVKNKEFLYNLLGKELIVEKPITLSFIDREKISKDSKLMESFYVLNNEIEKLANDQDILIRNGWCNMGLYAIDCPTFLEDTDYTIISYENFDDGRRKANQKEFKAKSGEKSLKFLKKILRYVKKENPKVNLKVIDKAIYNIETVFSMLNQKQNLKGTLCLSIHPYDYMTASDNMSKWDSCFSIKNQGCNCAHTISAMNASTVMCAYLKSDKKMELFNDGDDTPYWNDKILRAWVVCDKDHMIVDSVYPDHYNEIFVEEVEKMINEVTNNYYAYKDTCKKRARFGFSMMWEDNPMRYKYNHNIEDIDKADMTFENNDEIYCAECGIEIMLDDDSGNCSSLLCYDCSDTVVCCNCGERIYRDEAYWDDDTDCWYCEDCYYDLQNERREEEERNSEDADDEPEPDLENVPLFNPAA